MTSPAADAAWQKRYVGSAGLAIGAAVLSVCRDPRRVAQGVVGEKDRMPGERLEMPLVGRPVGEARACVSAVLDEAGFPAGSVQAALVATELATNALRYGSDGLLTVTVDLDRRAVTISVTDSEPALPHVRDGDDGLEGGHGLVIVDHLRGLGRDGPRRRQDGMRVRLAARGRPS